MRKRIVDGIGLTLAIASINGLLALADSPWRFWWYHT